MANLVVWASGLLEVLADKDTPLDRGPITLARGTREYMHGLMIAHGEHVTRETVLGWFVPGTKPVPSDPDEAAVVQRDNMTLVIAFNKKLDAGRKRRKGK